MKKIRKSFWRAYWKLHDKKKMLVARLKGYLDGLPPKTRKRIVLTMLAAFTVLALYTFGKAVYDIGRNDGKELGIEHIRRLQLPNDSIINPFESGRHGTGGEVE